MNKILIENEGGYGAIHQPIRRKIHRFIRRLNQKNLSRGLSVDWSKGSQYRPLLTGKLPIKDQGQNSSCGGQAGSYFLQIQEIIRGISEGELSAKSVYAPIAYPGGGTTIPSLMTQIGAHGANLEVAVPSYDMYRNPLNDAMMSDVSWRTPATDADAVKRAGYMPYDIDNNIESVASAINADGAVIWEIALQDGHVPGWRSATPQPPSKNNPNPIDHHFMCAYDFMIDASGNKIIIALQSEGPSWGVNGIQFFTQPYFDSGYIDAFTFIYDAKLDPTSSNHSIWAEVVRYFKMQPWFKSS